MSFFYLNNPLLNPFFYLNNPLLNPFFYLNNPLLNPFFYLNNPLLNPFFYLNNPLLNPFFYLNNPLLNPFFYFNNPLLNPFFYFNNPLLTFNSLSSITFTWPSERILPPRNIWNREKWFFTLNSFDLLKIGRFCYQEFCTRINHVLLSHFITPKTNNYQCLV